MRLSRPFFPYFGSKFRVASRYPVPECKIIEPFAGSAGYSCCYPDYPVLLYDADPIIVGVWDYLISAKEAEILSLPDTIDSVEEISGPQEARWLVGFWLNRSSSPCKKPGAWMRSGKNPSSFWGEAVKNSIAGNLRRIRHWCVRHCSWDEISIEPATWFVDPPYQLKGVNYRFGSRGIDYSLLGNWCRNLPGTVIVCENNGAEWLPFSKCFDIQGTISKRTGIPSSEAVWVNSRWPAALS